MSFPYNDEHVRRYMTLLRNTCGREHRLALRIPPIPSAICFQTNKLALLEDASGGACNPPSLNKAIIIYIILAPAYRNERRLDD